MSLLSNSRLLSQAAGDDFRTHMQGLRQEKGGILRVTEMSTDKEKNRQSVHQILSSSRYVKKNLSRFISLTVIILGARQIINSVSFWGEIV